MDRGMQMGQDGEPSGAAPLRDASRRNEELADLLLEADEPKAREEGPIWTCAGCGNHDKARIKWHRSGGYFDPPEYDPECMECGSGDIEEGFAEVLGKVISQRDKLQEKVEELELKAGLPAPEAASAEGSPSELDALRTELEEEKTARMSAERALDDWLEVHKKFAAAWKANGSGPLAHPSGPSQDSQEVEALDEITDLCWVAKLVSDPGDLLAGYSRISSIVERLRAALSQSPKGAAGAGIDKAALTKELFDFGKAAQLASDDVGLTRMALRSAACILKLAEAGDGPSAPKTGLRGASRLGGADELDSLADQPCTCTVHDGSHDCPSCEARAAINGAAESRRDALRAIKRKAPSSAPLSEAKGSDLPPSSQPAPGDVGEAGGDKAC